MGTNTSKNTLLNYDYVKIIYSYNECKVCNKKNPVLILEPCKHECMCIECFDNTKKCPICDMNINNVSMD